MYTKRYIWLSLLTVIWLLVSACKPITAPSKPDVTNTGETSTISLSIQNEDEPARYRPIEFILEGIPSVDNPFDPTQADTQVNFISPSGKQGSVGAFWYQSYSPSGNQASDAGGWRARFTPTESGEWRAKAVMAPLGLHSKEVRFTVSGGQELGFIRVDPNHPRYFAYETGSRFIPIGINMGWWDDDPIADYTRWLDHLAANDGNTIRVWMANWAFGLEWNDTPLGDYQARMRQAWLLDQLFRLADERRIQVILVLNHHGQFSRSVNPQWDDNPYNAELGGPLTSPEKFATDPLAIALFQQRLRYIIDRWGSAPNLFAWEWWNEYNFTPITDAQMEDWVGTMDAFLTERDPYDHLVTISGPAGPESPIWQLPGIDFVSVHIYSTNDPLHFASELTADYIPSVPEKPLLLAEFGYATGEETVDSIEKSGIHLHNGLWAAIFSGQAGTGMYWWWDTYVEPLNLWPHFGSLAKFLDSLDLAQFTPAPVVVQGDGEQAQAEGLLLSSDIKLLLWIRGDAYTAMSATEAYDAAVRNALRNRETLTDFVYEPPQVSGHSVEIRDLRPGSYEVHWFDPQTGEWGITEVISSVDGLLTIPLPTFDKDLAAKITLIQ